jgi:hypothetical protein
MAGPYGSTFVGYRHSPLGRALQGIGQDLGQGISQAGQGLAQGLQNQQARQEREEDRALEDEKGYSLKRDLINSDYNTAIANGADPAEAARVRDEMLGQIPAPRTPRAPQRTGLGRILNPAPAPAATVTPPAPAEPPAPQVAGTEPKGLGVINKVPEPATGFGQVTADGKKRQAEATAKAEEEKNLREAREALSNAGYEGYVGRIAGLPPPDALTNLDAINQARGVIVAYEKDRSSKRAELMAAAAQGNAQATRLLQVMNAYDNDSEVMGATGELNQANFALDLAAQAEAGDPTAQSSYRRVVASMMNKGALSDADVRDVTGDTVADNAKKTISRWISGDETALTKAQQVSLRNILETKRNAANARLAARQEYFMNASKQVQVNWTPPKPPQPAPQPPAPAAKQLTKAMAMEYLRKAGGDKNKARDMARKDGWSF